MEAPAADAQNDVDIWDEPKEGNIIHIERQDFWNGEYLQIKSATINQIIIAITSTDDTNLEMDATKIFLSNYHGLISQHNLLRKLIKRFQVPHPPGMSTLDYNKLRVPIQMKVVGVLKTWIREGLDTFDEQMQTYLKLFIEGSLKLEHKSEADYMLKCLNDKDAALSESLPTEPPPTPILPKLLPADLSGETIMETVDPQEIARQMTILDYQNFCAILPTEWLLMVQNRVNSREVSPHIHKMIDYFSELCNWVGYTILSKEKVSERGKIVTKFIQLADSLLKLNNFYGSMAIISGLSLSSIYRLKFTRDQVSKTAQNQLEHLEWTFKTESSYKAYRAALHMADPPCVPYFGVPLTDLNFIMEGNPQYYPGNLVNFRKLYFLYNITSQVNQYQGHTYNLHPVPEVARVLEHPLKENITEQQLYELSIMREPRGATSVN